MLESFYDRGRQEIAKVLTDLISSPGVQIAEADLHLDALARYGHGTAHFVDCVIAAHAAASGSPVASFDKDFRKFPDVKVEND